MIGLDDSQIAALTWLCGTPRRATSVSKYLEIHSWSETDFAIVADLNGQSIASQVHVLLIKPVYWVLHDYFRGSLHIRLNRTNTERELRVLADCPEVYETLAADLATALNRAGNPPLALKPSWQPSGTDRVLIETTSSRPVAMRFCRPYLKGDGENADDGESIVLALAEGANVAAWFRAFLLDVRNHDPDRVPQAPPRLGDPSDWYTPEEKEVARRIEKVGREVERLQIKQECLQAELVQLGEEADRGIRRIIWADGDDLVESVRKVLSDLGFDVQDMDSAVEPGQPKREDFRLTHDQHTNWEAIVEVKGYMKGTRTNDARQIREHRERYIVEEGKRPDLTLWIANPYRTTDPSTRPAPDGNVREAARLIGAVYLLASDLYQQWVLVAEGSRHTSDVVKGLLGSDPGQWTPSPNSDP